MTTGTKALILAVMLMTLSPSGAAFADGHHHGGGHFQGSVVIGGPFWWPSWYYPPYYAPYYPYYNPYYYYPPAVSAPSTPPAYIEQGEPAEPSAPSEVWYYCREKKAYYPYVRKCPGGWQTVPAEPPAEQKE